MRRDWRYYLGLLFLGACLGVVLLFVVQALVPPDPPSTVVSHVCPPLDTPATCTVEHLRMP